MTSGDELETFKTDINLTEYAALLRLFTAALIPLTRSLVRIV